MPTRSEVHAPLRTIALEEACLHPKLWEQFPAALQKQYAPVRGPLTDVGPERIRKMDAAGIDVEVLSHVAPGVQFLEDVPLAIRLCRDINDWLAEAVRAHPDRFAGFAMLPTQSPRDAADELERTVTQLGFRGALINGHTHGRYLDDEKFGVLLERAQTLDVPIYIHPTDPPPAILESYFRNDLALVTGWGWLVETGTHLLRMVSNGVFDRYPGLKIIVGHMGELIPYCLTRLNVALTMGNWMLAGQEPPSGDSLRRRVMEKSLRYYMRQNIFITTSGVFDQPVLTCALSQVGIDNVLFSVDAPFRDRFEATEFLHAAQMSPADKEKLAHGNAERLLHLAPAPATAAAPATPPLAAARTGSFYAFKARFKSRVGRALISALVR